MTEQEIEALLVDGKPDFGWCEEGLEEYAVSVWVCPKGMFVLQQGLGAGYYCDFRGLVQRLHEIMQESTQ